MKCKFCGSEFEAPSRGRKREYCYKDECIRKARNEACKRYHEKLKEPKEEVKVVEETKIKEKVQESKISADEIGELRQLGREINALKFKVFEIYQALGKEQSIYDKEDTDFLHLIENIDLDDINVIEKIKQAKENRKNRRSIKERQRILHTLLNIFPENAEKLVLDLIKQGEDFGYKPRISESGEVREKPKYNNYNKTNRGYNNYKKY